MHIFIISSCLLIYWYVLFSLVSFDIAQGEHFLWPAGMMKMKMPILEELLLA